MATLFIKASPNKVENKNKELFIEKDWDDFFSAE